MFGSCGSLDSDKRSGKFIIPSQAYRGEGLSYYFAPAADYIEIKNSKKLIEIFTDLEVPFVSGRVWTTDSIVRETENLVRKRKEEGCLAVEMELAGVEAVSNFYGFELYDFLVAGDVLGEKDYDFSGLADANHNINKFQLALKIVEKI